MSHGAPLPPPPPGRKPAPSRGFVAAMAVVGVLVVDGIGAAIAGGDDPDDEGSTIPSFSRSPAGESTAP